MAGLVDEVEDGRGQTCERHNFFVTRVLQEPTAPCTKSIPEFNLADIAGLIGFGMVLEPTRRQASSTEPPTTRGTRKAVLERIQS
jgi:hypothetical protein